MRILFISRSTLFSQPGGDTLQMEETAKALKKSGVEVSINPEKPDPADYDLIHGFNLIRPAALLPYCKWNKPLVLSSVYVDYSEYDGYHRKGIAKIAIRISGPSGFEYWKAIWRGLNGSDHFPPLSYLLKGHLKSMQEVLQKSVCVLATSHQETELIRKQLKTDFHFSIVPLGSEHIEVVKPNKRSGVLCVARMEGLKNQINLIKALRYTGIPLKLTGNIGKNQGRYARKCEELMTSNIRFLGRVTHEELAREYASAKVHALPSYYETTGLSTLEALKSGCQVVITDRGGQKEIFKDHAHFCDPDSPESIRNAILKAFEAEENHSRWVKENFSWERAAKDILDIYHKVLNPQKA